MGEIGHRGRSSASKESQRTARSRVLSRSCRLRKFGRSVSERRAQIWRLRADRQAEQFRHQIMLRERHRGRGLVEGNWVAGQVRTKRDRTRKTSRRNCQFLRDRWFLLRPPLVYQLRSSPPVSSQPL